MPDENYSEIELNVIKPKYQICLHPSYCDSILDAYLRTEQNKGQSCPQKVGKNNLMQDNDDIQESVKNRQPI